MSKFCPHCGCEYGKEGSHDENVAVCTKAELPLSEFQSKPIENYHVDWRALFPKVNLKNIRASRVL